MTIMILWFQHLVNNILWKPTRDTPPRIKWLSTIWLSNLQTWQSEDLDYEKLKNKNNKKLKGKNKIFLKHHFTRGRDEAPPKHSLYLAHHQLLWSFVDELTQLKGMPFKWRRLVLLTWGIKKYNKMYIFYIIYNASSWRWIRKNLEGGKNNREDWI